MCEIVTEHAALHEYETEEDCVYHLHEKVRGAHKDEYGERDTDKHEREVRSVVSVGPLIEDTLAHLFAELKKRGRECVLHQCILAPTRFYPQCTLRSNRAEVSTRPTVY